MGPHLEKIKSLLSLPLMKEFSRISRGLSRVAERQIAESTIESLPLEHQKFLAPGRFDDRQLVSFPAMRLADPELFVADLTEFDTASAKEIRDISFRGGSS